MDIRHQCITQAMEKPESDNGKICIWLNFGREQLFWGRPRRAFTWHAGSELAVPARILHPLLPPLQCPLSNPSSLSKHSNRGLPNRKNSTRFQKKKTQFREISTQLRGKSKLDLEENQLASWNFISVQHKFNLIQIKQQTRVRAKLKDFPSGRRPCVRCGPWRRLAEYIAGIMRAVAGERSLCRSLLSLSLLSLECLALCFSHGNQPSGGKGQWRVRHVSSCCALDRPRVAK